MALGGYLTIEATQRANESAAILQEESLHSQETQEDRQNRQGAYFGYMLALDEYFRVTFVMIGCEEIENVATISGDRTRMPFSCNEPVSSQEFGSKYLAYRDARNKLQVYGTESAREHIDRIDAILPPADPNDPTGLTLDSIMIEHEQFVDLYSALQQISRCDLLANPSVSDNC